MEDVKNNYLPLMAQMLGVQLNQVSGTVKLLDEGCTIPFIARYRKEATQGLDEVKIAEVQSLYVKMGELLQRKTYILETIAAQGKLSPELEKSIRQCWDHAELDDLYLPYKPKRKTRASMAREKGLEPLALWLMKEPPGALQQEAARYLNEEVPDEESALEGARDIVAELMNEDAQARALLRQQFEKHAVFYSQVAKGKEEAGSKYRDYFDFAEPLKKCPSHRLLALFRGEEEAFLKLKLEPDEELSLKRLAFHFIRKNSPASQQLELALKDAYKRLLAPSMENEFRTLAKARADEEAIKVFTENLRQLLLSAPLGSKRILAIDPGFRSGCKVVCLNEEGRLLQEDIIYPHEPQRERARAAEKLIKLATEHHVEAIAVGNGTAGRETEELLRSIKLPGQPPVFMVNENGASVYSASDIAREEFPDKDVTVRGAVSIGRRLADPLAELVKIDPKSIGVGQYQHDVDQAQLKKSLDTVVQSCVNRVGVNLNTASKSLLTYVSGLGPQTAQNIINYRNEHGAFSARNQLKKVARLGDKAFEQCAAFLRIPQAKNPLDNSAVHPESYAIVEAMAKKQGCTVADLINQEALRKNIRPEDFVSEKAGLPTITDILKELAKPGRDPREQLQAFSFADVKSPEQLQTGMVLPGIVTNITRFGCFVDVGVKQDGMVHISEMADRFVKDPAEVVKLQQQVKVKVLEVDLQRKRISLSLKGV